MLKCNLRTILIIGSIFALWISCDNIDNVCTELVIDKRGTTQICEPAGVRVTFFVSDCDGNPISGLTESNFTVINDEKGTPFESEGEAASVIEAQDFEFYSILVLDLSNSIVYNNRLNDVLDGARTFIDQMVVNQSDAFKHNVAIYVFGSTDYSELIQDFTKTYDDLDNALKNLEDEQGRGSTNLYGAFIKGLDLVEEKGSSEMVIRSLIILTDGTDEAGAVSREAALSRLSSTNVYTYSIGIRGDYKEEFIKELASKEEYFFLVEDTEEIINAFSEISNYVEQWSKSNYVMGVCSPLEIPNVSLTITVEKDDKTGSLTVPYDASGFSLVGCHSEDVAMGVGCSSTTTVTPSESTSTTTAYESNTTTTTTVSPPTTTSSLDICHNMDPECPLAEECCCHPQIPYESFTPYCSPKHWAEIINDKCDYYRDGTFEGKCVYEEE